MKTNTRLFGEIDIAEDKIITFEKGMIGFPDLKKFTLIYDAEKEGKSLIMWLQSMEDGELAFPVLRPENVLAEYRPTVHTELLEPLGELNEENTYILVVVTVPKQIENISVNLKAPIIINMDTNQGSQLIIEDKYEVRHKIYKALQAAKQEAGE